MKLAHYLPSSQFTGIVFSIALSAAFIAVAQYVTHAPATSSEIASVPADQPSVTDWKQSLDEIQATAPGLPETPDPETVSSLLEAAKTDNRTETAARTLLINLTDAGTQGLGNDIPTQERIIEDTMRQFPDPKPSKTYTAKDIRTVADSSATRRAYGNTVMEVLGRHTGATSKATYYAIGTATNNNSPAALSALPQIQREYASLVSELAGVEVPATLIPLHLQLLNSLGTTAVTFDDMKFVISDPLRGLQGLQNYQDGLDEAARLFTSIAESFAKNGILFNKDEPGDAWSVFVST